MTPIIMQVAGTLVNIRELQSHHLQFNQIVTALAKIPRWAGQNPGATYPVSRHSVLLSHLVSKHLALEALLHDASEFLLSDIPSPIKDAFPELKKLETVIATAIFIRFHPGHRNIAEYKMSEEVKYWDDKIKLFEYHHLFHKLPPWTSKQEFLDISKKVDKKWAVANQFVNPVEYGPAIEEFNQRYLELI